ncbi:MAG: CAP domain-containing protein [Candidatus Peregrinibacteria bacterium]|nr:CAP domain-containing protein [Candidatus Peregrinibacteria bacterium]
MKKNHQIRISKNITALIISGIIGLTPLMSLSVEAATTSGDIPTTGAISAPQKTTSLREQLKIKRALRKAELEKRRAARLAKSRVSFVPQTGFDEYQLASLTQDTYENSPKPTKKTGPTSSSIDTSFFANIELSESAPTKFFQDEIYILSGKITSPAKVSTMFAFLNYQDEAQKEQFKNFETEAKNNTFSIPLYLSDEGSYSLGVVPGTNGKSRIQEINVAAIGTTGSDVTSTSNSAAPHVSYDAATDKSSIGWTRSEDGIYRVTFEQGSEKVTYITRQSVSSLPIRYADFKKFKPGNINIKIDVLPKSLSGSWKTVGSTTTPIAYHGFRAIEKSAVDVSGSLPAIMNNLSAITIQGTALVNIENEGYITNTQGLTEKVTLQTDHPLVNSPSLSIAKGSTFSFSYMPKVPGRYIVEINDAEGSAAINIPVYVSTGTPLIPDYIDLNATMKVVKKPTDIIKDREYILGLINDIRTGMGKQKVTLSAPLNSLAQKHADDMEARNFFGHVNPDGASPDDRRKQAGISTEVGENLAYSPSLLSSMQGLLRSPIHRANILADTWTSVGIGISQDTSKGELRVVQEFAPAPLTNEGLASLESNILSTINSTRNSSTISSLTEDETLKNLAQKWSDHLAKTDEFGLTTKDGQSLSQLVENANLQSTVQIFVFSTNSTNNLASRILEPSSSTESKWNKIGLGVSVTPLGEIKITTLLSK